MSSNQTPPTREEIIHAITILGVHAEVLDAIRGVHGDGALRTLQRFAFGLCCGELAIGNTQRCDCGAKLTSCHDCAVGDYQAAHPACKDCCPPPAQTHAEKLALVALNQVSHDADGRCLWCRRAEHKPDCLREAAMRLLSPPLR